MMLVCDSQVHIWAEETPERPWTPGGKELVRDMGHRPKAIGYEELKDLMDEAGVDRAIIVPPTWDMDRNDLGLEAAEKYPDRFGLISRVPLLEPEVGKKLLHDLRDEPACKGVRLTFFRKEEATWLFDGTADWYWPLAEELGVPTMIHAAKFAPQVAEIAENHPNLQLILDHMGVPGGTKDDNCQPYVEETVMLARFPNVSIKLSSLPAKTTQPYPYENLEPYVRQLVTAFGPMRCYWGTDLSRIIGVVGGTYRQCVTHFTEEMEFLSDDDLDLIMGRALCNALNWPVL
jgi:predicted TIM-barrel fold metal-dependent hydrolase